MHGLDSQVAMHRLNINSDAKSVKQQQRQFRPGIMEAIQSEVKKLIDFGFIREVQHPDWVANTPLPRKMGRSGFALIFAIYIRPVLKTNSPFQSQIS